MTHCSRPFSTGWSHRVADLDPPAASDLVLETEMPLDADEARYASAARAPNTMRGYRSDWKEWSFWCEVEGFSPIPAEPGAVSRYLTELARHGAAVGTMSRRLSAIRFGHQLRDLPNPADHARVATVWEGIRRTHGAEPDAAAPLLPPELFEVLDACPVTRAWTTSNRPSEPSLAGLRDRALILVGFVGALRRSEIAAIEVEHLHDHELGVVIALPRSKTNQTGEQAELVVLPRVANKEHCAVEAITRWRDTAGIDDGPLFRRVTKGNRPGDKRLNPGAINDLVQKAITRAGIDASPYSAHSLRAGFVTYAHLRGINDRAIMHQTRHRSLTSLGKYIRWSQAWEDNAATQLGF